MDAVNKLSRLMEQIDLNSVQNRELKALIRELRRDKRVSDFKLERTLKDKRILTNVLNTTIQELEQQKQLVEEQSKQLLSNLAELKRSYDELEQFSYIVSHDLKSPLRTISNFAQLIQLRHEDQLSGEAIEFLDFIVNGVHQMHDIIGDLLAYAQVGKRSHKPLPVPAIGVIKSVKATLQGAIRETGAKILAPKTLPVLMVKKWAVSQLFQNLISNAIKFRSEAKPVIKITARQIDHEFWEFRVMDNGVGMDETYQEKAFLPFQRLNNSNQPGTGIGLAICKKVVKMHGGDIRFQSKRGVGTTFIFTLPHCKEMAAINNNIPKPAAKNKIDTSIKNIAM